MTVIKSIKLRGFKSFAKKTDVPFSHNYSLVLGANGAGKSISGDNKVFLNNGEIKPIGRLVNRALKSSNKIKQLDDGVYTDNSQNLKILSLNPYDMKIEEKKISKFIKRKGEPSLYEIKTRTRRKIVATSCHPVMVFRKNAIVSTLIRDLNENDFIATPRILKFNGNKNIKIAFSVEELTPRETSEEFARFIGYLIGDGYITYNRIELINKNQEIINDFKELAKNLFGIDNLHERKEKNSTRLIYWSKELPKFFRYLFRSKSVYKLTGKYKIIPPEFFISDNKTIANLLAALFDTDGYIPKSISEIEFSSKNETLIDQVQTLLLRFGIISRKSAKIKCATNTKEKIKRKYYSLYISGIENFKRFYKNIPLNVNYKKENLRKFQRDIKPNPNIDLIPQNANELIKDCVKFLGLKVKPLGKRYPKLRAYYSNACCPSRRGLNEILGVFVDRWFDLYTTYYNIELKLKSLINDLEIVNIPSVQASHAIGLNKQMIAFWKSGPYQPKTINLIKFYDYLKERLANKLIFSKEIISILGSLAYSDIFWDRIKCIKKVKGEKWVYDLAIEENHNFVANNIFVHNSNVVDAVCFVLGRTSAKSLRAEKTANLIYNGGKSKQPAKDAEVSIAFDNSKNEFPSKDKDIEITRIVKQSGLSTYKINNEVRTRQQVIDLLSAAKIDPEGHNIIQQGDIARFIEMKPVERRELIEETAGISIYEDKKQKAISDLENVQNKLNEANIVLKEREAYLRELKKDRDQALRYKELEKNIKENKATYLHLQIKDKEKKREEIEGKIKEFDNEIKKVQNQINEIKKLIEEKKTVIKKINEEVEQKGEKEQIKLHKEIEELKAGLIKNESRKEVCINEIEKIKTRKIQLNKNIEDININIQKLNKQKDEFLKEKNTITATKDKTEKEIAEFKSKYNIQEDLDNKIEDVEKIMEEKQNEINKLQEAKQSSLNSKNQILLKIENLDEKIKAQSAIENENREKFNKLKNSREELKRIIAELEQKLKEDSSASNLLNEQRKKLIAINEEMARLKARQITVKEKTASDVAIKRVLELKQGIYGTVSELGKVDSKYALALEVAAGARIRSVIVENDPVAAKCIKVLKENKLGVVTFLPLNKIKSAIIKQEVKNLASTKGVIDFAINLISFDPKFKNAFSYAFGDTLVVENINIARKIGIGNARMVTLEGDLLEQSGAMIGGYRRSFGGFREKDVDLNVKNLEEELLKLKEDLVNLEEKKIKFEDEIFKLKEKKVVLEVDINALEKTTGSSDVKKIEEEKIKFEKELKIIEEKTKEIEKNILSLVKDIEKLKQTKQNLRTKSPAVVQNLTKLENERQDLMLKFVEINSELKNINTQIQDVHIAEKNKINEITNNHNKEQEKFGIELQNLTEDIKNKKVLLKELESKERKFYADYKNLFSKRNKLNEFVNRKESLIAREEDKIKYFENRKNSISLDRAKVVAELEGLNTEFENYADAKIRRNIALEELKYEIKKFENLLKEMGNVNLRALEIYEKVHNEYESILAKVEKLKQEREDVLSLMREIDSKKQDIFIKTFKILNENFRNIFASLSTKGEAHLEIENKENVFEGGVEIKVRIASNKFMDIRSLSGGEKSLTALSFIFAIQDYAPANFYLLDEVDAALDKINSVLLSKLIKKYSQKAQYIVISHNDTVISEADTLYGVSMQDGISKVISLRV